MIKWSNDTYKDSVTVPKSSDESDIGVDVHKGIILLTGLGK